MAAYIHQKSCYKYLLVILVEGVPEALVTKKLTQVGKHLIKANPLLEPEIDPFGDHGMPQRMNTRIHQTVPCIRSLLPRLSEPGANRSGRDRLLRVHSGEEPFRLIS